MVRIMACRSRADLVIGHPFKQLEFTRLLSYRSCGGQRTGEAGLGHGLLAILLSLHWDLGRCSSDSPQVARLQLALLTALGSLVAAANGDCSCMLPIETSGV